MKNNFTEALQTLKKATDQKERMAYRSELHEDEKIFGYNVKSKNQVKHPMEVKIQQEMEQLVVIDSKSLKK